MSSNYLEYKVAVFIEDVLKKHLNKNRKTLIEQQKDESCSTETYENTLDFCSKLEYAIKQMEMFK